ncbi:MAG TPA: HD domain-containing phosphohydrolase [Noviherbaspirillum sp.]
MTEQELRVLILEDVPTDAELMMHELRRAGMAAVSRRVTTREAFVEALDDFHPDVILLDFRLPHFDGKSAIQIARSGHPEIPLVIVTGTLADEPAIDLLRAGARDYVLKNNLVRLPTAVRRAIAEEHGIRKRKRAEKALQEAHALLRKVTDTSPIGITVWGLDGRMTFANPEAEKILGRRHEELNQLPYNAPEWQITDFGGNPIREEDLPLRRVLDFGKPVYDIRMAITGRDGKRKLLSVNAAPLRTGKNVIEGVVTCLDDVTEHEEAVEALRNREEQMRLAMSAATMGAWSLVLATGRMTHSEEARVILGLPEGAKVESVQDFLPLVHADEREDIAVRLRNAIVRPQGQTLDFRVVWPDGSIHWVSSKGALLHDTAGKPCKMLGILWDISARKANEIALDRANRALRVLSSGNERLVHAQDEQSLLHDVCRVIVEEGGYSLAWVGIVQNDERKSVMPVAHHGDGADFLARADISWGDSERGQGPTGTAIRTGTVQVIREVDHDPVLQPWLEDAEKFGYNSAIALPLRDSKGVFGTLTIYASQIDAFNHPEIRLMQELADDLAFGVTTLRMRAERDRLVTEQLEQQTELRRSLIDSIQVLASALELRDPYTAGHQRRVAALAGAIAREIGLPEDRVEGLMLAASIHDLGKIQAPAEILNKPGRLAAVEFDLIKLHAQAGHDIIKDVRFPWPIARMILEHHERLDGTGYPRGTRGDDTLLESRILTVADVVEAMTSHRPYRPGLGLDAALKEIVDHRGTWFEPLAVDACVRLFREGRFSFGPTADAADQD